MRSMQEVYDKNGKTLLRVIKEHLSRQTTVLASWLVSAFSRGIYSNLIQCSYHFPSKNEHFPGTNF